MIFYLNQHCFSFCFQALKTYVSDIDVRLYMLAILIPLILVNWIRNLKFLAPCSTVANFITFVSFGIILYYIFREPLSFENREVIGNVENFPLYFGTVLFALEAIGVVSTRSVLQYLKVWRSKLREIRRSENFEIRNWTP